MKKYRVRLLPSAYADLTNARSWYRQHGASLPKHFTNQLSLTIDHIKVSPYAYAVRYKNVHIAHLNIFPYAVHFGDNHSNTSYRDGSPKMGKQIEITLPCSPASYAITTKIA